MSAVLFFIAAIGALAGAVGVVVIRNPFYSVLSLVSHLIALAALFLLLRAEFVAAAQVIVYAGAVMVLYVFVVAYVGGADTPLHRPGGSLRFLAPLFGVAVAVELCIAMLGTALKGISSEGAPYVLGFGTPKHIGTLFLTTYLFPFEIASLLLLVAAIGAVMLARRRRGLEPDDAFEARLQVPRSAFSGTMAEAAGFREGAGTTTDAHEQTEPIGAQTGRTPSPPPTPNTAGVGSSGEQREGGW
ncbi:MAG TPA: NADH-quinone oxidoreductase subunit J [Solirubrobacteraceae bacterium]|nr:NADH-quinone oxidoreductase subunit J [Solirubrobacteraceae bacterium]